MNQKEAAEAVKVYESITACQTRLRQIDAARVDGNVLKLFITGKGGGYGHGYEIVARHSSFPMGSPSELTLFILNHLERNERAALQNHLRRLAQLGCEKPEGV